MKAQRIVVTEFGTRAFPDPCKTIWGRFMSYFSTEMSDNDNVNIYPVGDQLYASTETNFIRRVDQNSLATHEKVDLSKYLTINMATAHPHLDNDKNVYNMGSSFGPRGKYNLIKIPNVEKPFENASIVCSIPMERTLNPAYYHSFSITENYYIFIEQPLVLSVPTLAMSHITGKSYSDCLTWKPNLRVCSALVL
jgi:carotenoid cleavage dioxygenase-like enzyme